MPNQAIGLAISIEINTNTRYSFDSNKNILIALAPFTFLIPISFVRISIMNNDNPISPIHDIIIARKEE